MNVLWNALALQFQHGLQIQKILFVSSIIAHFPLKLFCKSSKINSWFILRCKKKKQIKYSTQVKIIQLTWIHVSSNLNSFEAQKKNIESLYISNRAEFVSTIIYFLIPCCKSVFQLRIYWISVNIKKVHVNMLTIIWIFCIVLNVVISSH